MAAKERLAIQCAQLTAQNQEAKARAAALAALVPDDIEDMPLEDLRRTLKAMQVEVQALTKQLADQGGPSGS